MKFNLLSSLAMLLLAAVGVQAQDTLYVTEHGAGKKDGTSWDNASEGYLLQTRINQLSAMPKGGTIFVASGTYYPTLDATGTSSLSEPRNRTFVLKKNIKLYGGFDTQITNINKRSRIDKNGDNKIDSWELEHETFLSGDIDALPADRSKDCFHVVTNTKSESVNTVLDGFTISYGNADLGGGIIMSQGLVKSCVLSSNRSSNGGSGAYLYGGILDSCAIINNEAYSGHGGGAVLNGGGEIKNSLIADNISDGSAGGVLLNYGGTLTSCSIINNFSSGDAGGVYISFGGRIVSSVIANNTAQGTAGGVIFSSGGIILSSTIANNSSKLNSGCSGEGQIINSIIQDQISNNTKVSYSLVAPRNNAFKYSSNILTAVDSVGFIRPTKKAGQITAKDEVATVYTADWSLLPSSPAVNRGAPIEEFRLFALSTLDLAAKPRIAFDSVDMGAFECQSSKYIRYVTEAGAGDKTGVSWANAYPSDSLQVAIEKTPREVWVAAGTYYPTYGTDNASKTFYVNREIKLYGGFAGNESDPSQRIKKDLDGNGSISPWELLNQSVLSGDIDKDRSSDGNCRIVVNIVTYAQKKRAIIDGFIVSDGCNINENADIQGGGIKADSAIIRNCIIRNNRVNYSGGGLFVSNSTVQSCLITKNAAMMSSDGGNRGGGGVYANKSKLLNCKITNNIASGLTRLWGGGAHVSNTLLYQCEITNNTNISNNAMGGGVYLDDNVGSHSVVQYCTIAGNAAKGADMFTENLNDFSFIGEVTIENSIIASGMYIRNNLPKTRVSYVATKGGYSDFGSGEGIIDVNSTDLKFIKPTSYIGASTTAEQEIEIANANWALRSASRVVNAGKISDTLKFDLAGNRRVQFDGLDLGAYETTITRPESVKSVFVTKLTDTTVQVHWKSSQTEFYSVWVRESTLGRVLPVDGQVYSSNSVLGLGTSLDGWLCVYNGVDTLVRISNISNQNNYRFMVCAYNGDNYRLYNNDFEALNPTTITTQHIDIVSKNTIKWTEDYYPQAQVSSGLPISFSSSDSTIARPIGNKISLLKTGTVRIIAHQSGNQQYLPADSVGQTLTIVPADQKITVQPIITMYDGETAFPTLAEASSKGRVEVVSINPEIVSVDKNGLLWAHRVGFTQLIFTQEDKRGLYNPTKDTSYIVACPDLIVWRDTSVDFGDKFIPKLATYKVLPSPHVKIETKNGRDSIIFSDPCWYGTEVLLGTAYAYGDSIDFHIRVTHKQLIEQIEFVTVDSKEDKNLIIWQQSRKAGISKYKILRSGEAYGVYNEIATIDWDTLKAGIYVDQTARPRRQSYAYQMLSIDKNGKVSEPSIAHRTMNLQVSAGLKNDVQLHWSDYEGVPFSSYIIYRQNAQSLEFEPIGTTTFNMFNDYPPVDALLNYRVAINLGRTIYPTRVKSDTGPFSQSLSNMSEAALVGVNDIHNSPMIGVWPVPASESVKLSNISAFIGGTLHLFASDGAEIIISKSIEQSEISIPVHTLARGVYRAVLTNNKESKAVSIVVE